MGLSQVFLNYVFSLPNSRKNETEACVALPPSRLPSSPSLSSRHLVVFPPLLVPSPSFSLLRI